MKLHYFTVLIALACNITFFSATNVSTQPMIASTTTTVPAALTSPAALPVTTYPVNDTAINDCLGLPTIWNVLWAKIEANVLAAWRLMAPAPPLFAETHASLAMNFIGVDMESPIGAIMKDYVPTVYDLQKPPPIEEILEAALTPELSAEIAASRKRSNDILDALCNKSLSGN